MVQALLIALVAAIGVMDYQMGTLYIFRPIVLGPLVGAVLGDFQQGVIIGASLELFFMGAVSVGAYIPPDTIVGGVLGTAFAISLKKGPEVAVTLAMPIALLSLAVGNFIDAFVPMILKYADKAAAKGNIKGIYFIHWIIGGLNVLRRFVLVFAGYYIGVDKMIVVLDAIPKVLIDGMGAAAGLLPALGFAMLMRMILNKQLVPFFFLGFVLAAYMKVPVLGIAILGVIYVIVKFDFLNPNKNEPAIETNVGGVLEDEDF
ncbi:PTS mannose/fructose/sorbose/N-acetylgalactosamine transporter subunit IIC [Clostridium brassicae]|uniref:PTS sugar transporter subunit IIC n=1 Tax=Clostridium brassicae TaxID=2999072 RepID=A0ABT4DBI4_9CLOT|nr:PTS sugar transporter subunit IIC [Clostridium brassicae]MCY6958399.1 PTS sugar transporter subunit IIC [Clostridium brassicae]